jgi:hypothetical protein
MMHSACGRARASQERNFTEWRQGQTVPFSAGLDTRLWFDTTFVQKSVRVDVDRLEMLCARWLGRPLDQPLRFEMQPFPTSSSGPGNGRWPICGREKKKAWRSPVRQKPHSTSSC